MMMKLVTQLKANFRKVRKVQKSPKKWCQLFKIEHLLAVLPLHPLPFLHTGQVFFFSNESPLRGELPIALTWRLWLQCCGFWIWSFLLQMWSQGSQVVSITAQHWQEMALKSSVTQMMPLSLYAVRQSPYLVWVIPVSRSSHRYHFMLVITIPFYNSYQTEPRILAHITINKLSRTKRKQ